MRLCLTVAAVMLTIAAYASQPPFEAGYVVDSVWDADVGVSWNVSGKVQDGSPLGYTALDARTNDLVFCENIYGDIDMFRITNIVVQTATNLVCQVVYNEAGAPRIGSPVAGNQMICSFNTNNSPFEASQGAASVSEYLWNGARNLMANMAIAETAKRWSLYPATQTVNFAGYYQTNVGGIHLGNEFRTNWPTGGLPPTNWSQYPATQDVDIANWNITNVNGITLGGEYRTNWPEGIGVLQMGQDVGGDVTNTCTFPEAFSNIPYVVVSWADTNIDQLAQPEVVFTTNDFFRWRLRNGVGLTNYAWTIHWAASTGKVFGGGCSGGGGGGGPVTVSFNESTTNNAYTPNGTNIYVTFKTNYNGGSSPYYTFADGSHNLVTADGVTNVSFQTNGFASVMKVRTGIPGVIHLFGISPEPDDDGNMVVQVQGRGSAFNAVATTNGPSAAHSTAFSGQDSYLGNGGLEMSAYLASYVNYGIRGTNDVWLYGLSRSQSTDYGATQTNRMMFYYIGKTGTMDVVGMYIENTPFLEVDAGLVVGGTNSITLGGVARTNWPSGVMSGSFAITNELNTVTYPATLSAANCPMLTEYGTNDVVVVPKVTAYGTTEFSFKVVSNGGPMTNGYTFGWMVAQ